MSETLELLRKLWNSPSSRRAWTEEMKAAQAQRCRQFQPWVHSTGPKTKVGKARASLNSRSNRNKRDAQNFDILATLVIEIERLKQENIELLKAKEALELKSEVKISPNEPQKELLNSD